MSSTPKAKAVDDAPEALKAEVATEGPAPVPAEAAEAAPVPAEAAPAMFETRGGGGGGGNNSDGGSGWFIAPAPSGFGKGFGAPTGSPLGYTRSAASVMDKGEPALPSNVDLEFCASSYKCIQPVIFHNRGVEEVAFRIAAGRVFIPSSGELRQNIIIKHEIVVRIKAGGNVHTTPIGFCGNVNFGCCSRTPMTITEFKVREEHLKSQGTLWHAFKDHLADTRTSTNPRTGQREERAMTPEEKQAAEEMMHEAVEVIAKDPVLDEEKKGDLTIYLDELNTRLAASKWYSGAKERSDKRVEELKKKQADLQAALNQASKEEDYDKIMKLAPELKKLKLQVENVRGIAALRKKVAEDFPITAKNREKHVKRRMREEMKRMQERIDQLQERNGQLEKELEIAKGGTDDGSNVRRV
jgi:hypothetical protein